MGKKNEARDVIKNYVSLVAQDGNVQRSTAIEVINALKNLVEYDIEDKAYDSAENMVRLCIDITERTGINSALYYLYSLLYNILKKAGNLEEAEYITHTI